VAGARPCSELPHSKKLMNREIKSVGYGVFIVPEEEKSLGREISLTWYVPKDWTLINSHGQGTSQNLKTTISQLRHAVYTGGDFRVHRFEVQGFPVHLAMRGQWEIKDEELVETARKIFQLQRDFFSDYEYPFYFVTLIPTESGECCSLNGTGLTQSFAMIASPGKEYPSIDEFKFLLSHELFHNWNGRKIKRMDPEELVYWFSEGFTEFYTFRILVKGGLMSFQDYVKDVNQELREYFLSPVRNAPNRAILDGFWKNPFIDQLPYVRGHMIAQIWNARIKAQTGERLDDFMRDLFKAAQSEGSVVEPSTIDRLMTNHLSGGVGYDLDHWVEAGETVVFHPNALGPCARLASERGPSFEIGFDYMASFDAGKLVGVKLDSEAYRAGLRDGMEMLNLKTRHSDPRKEVTVTTRDGDGREKKISYLPKGPEVEIPAYVVDSELFAANPEACVAEL
jgi:predicted metalloprotease with PDZ domain